MLASLDQFELELRLGRLTTSSTAAARSSSLFSSRELGMFSTSDRRLVTSRTLELLKKIIGQAKWKSAAQLLLLLRGLGRELHSVGGFREPAIGNVVRRIMAAVREEALNEDTRATDDSSPSAAAPKPADTAPRRMSLQTMLWATPQPVKGLTHRRSGSFSSEADAFHMEMPASYHAERPELKQEVMEAIGEINSDLEDMHKNIDEQATKHIHADEVILTYGRSKTVEMV
jgi:translation initiation factor eIF-2B subunit beta